MTSNSAGESLYSALSTTWRAIQDRHPDVPDVLVTLSGTAGQGAVRLGRGGEHWQHGADGRELALAGDGLRTAGGALTSLLHEAAHAVAAVRGTRPTSNRGYYHNKRFKALAEELGLDVTETGARGWQHTRLEPDTERDYAKQLALLEQVLPLEADDEQGRPQRNRSRNRIPAICSCEQPVRAWAARGTLDTQRLICRECEQPLRPEHPEEEDPA